MEGQQQRLSQDVLCLLAVQEEDAQDQERNRGEQIQREL